MKLPKGVEQARAEIRMRNKYTPHRPTMVQERFSRIDALEALYGGAAGGGKSDALLHAALQYAHVPHYSAILFRKTFTDLALPGAIMDRSHEWLAETDARWDDRTKTWHFPSGATLTFGYMDGPQDRYRYASAEFQFIGFDELTQFLERDYLFLFSRLRKTHAVDAPLRMRAATNPGGVGHEWVGERFGIPAEPERGRTYQYDGRTFLPARVEDNPHLNLEEYERSLSQLDPVTRKQLREGHWVRDPSGLVYSSFTEAKNLTEVIDSLPEDEGWVHIMGCDFGVAKPTAFVVLAFSDHDPNVYVLKSDEWRGISALDACEIAKQWDSEYHFERIIGDTGGLGKDFEIIWRQRYFPMHAAKKENKLGYISLINSDFHHGKVKVVTGTNAKLVKDLKALAWADEKQNKEHPGLDNHLPDALLYAWREARHWNWEERERKPATFEERAKAEAEERKARVRERIRRRNDPDSDDWILGDD